MNSNNNPRPRRRQRRLKSFKPANEVQAELDRVRLAVEATATRRHQRDKQRIGEF